MEKTMTALMSQIQDNSRSESLNLKCQAELAEIVKQYTDVYADYGKCRQREVPYSTTSESNHFIINSITVQYIRAGILSFTTASKTSVTY